MKRAEKFFNYTPIYLTVNKIEFTKRHFRMNELKRSMMNPPIWILLALLRRERYHCPRNNYLLKFFRRISFENLQNPFFWDKKKPFKVSFWVEDKFCHGEQYTNAIKTKIKLDFIYNIAQCLKKRVVQSWTFSCEKRNIFKVYRKKIMLQCVPLKNSVKALPLTKFSKGVLLIYGSKK